MSNNNETKPLGKVVHIDEARIKDHLGDLACGSVEETLNALQPVQASSNIWRVSINVAGDIQSLAMSVHRVMNSSLNN